ncbi:uncharacterized protein N7503_010211 [Penicillium pulvis]|uniref:uncharacterized protein n=1 Tax=Penicillium pulvis TaxID=1562058 RepID=UPI0025470A75|nr:uncharacterized protein N7503_010211 [Penicillium pulvis]KAJ5784999.1 hypothetical protein N7503_010211 [Penicillium pulvis]
MESTERVNSPPMESMGNDNPQKERTQTQPNGKFRFKSSSSRSKHSSRKRHHSPSSSKPRERTHKRRPPHRPSSHVQDNPDSQSRSLSPGAAFRESLFDAMGDDEGAAYWEGVYGQPIHTYAVPEKEGPNGELEQMNEEEYAAYVRARMWERTREGMLDAQAKWREEQRKKKSRDRGRAEDAERRSFERAMEDSLRRGAERKKRKRWGEVWESYLSRWEEIGKIVKEGEKKDGEATATTTKPLRNLLFWPVESGKRVDVAPASVEEFMRHAPDSADLGVILKAERVRWHPDKIQHRYSGLGIDDVVMRSVTEVFQIVDRMWNEERERKG